MHTAATLERELPELNCILFFLDKFRIGFQPLRRFIWLLLATQREKNC